MSDTTTTADTPDLAAKIAALETSLATLAERHKPSDDEDDDPTSDVKALRQRLSKEAARRRDLAADLGRVTQEFAAIKQQHVEVATTAEQRIAALAQLPHHRHGQGDPLARAKPRAVLQVAAKAALPHVQVQAPHLVTHPGQRRRHMHRGGGFPGPALFVPHHDDMRHGPPLVLSPWARP